MSNYTYWVIQYDNGVTAQEMEDRLNEKAKEGYRLVPLLLPEQKDNEGMVVMEKQV